MLRNRMRLAGFRLVVADGVHLKGDVPARRLVVEDVGNRDAVQPGPNGGADCLHAKRVPVALLQGLLRGGLPGQRVQPACPRLVVDAAGPRPVGRVDLDLVPVLAAVLDRRVGDAAHHDAAVHLRVDLRLVLEDEIAKRFLRAQEAVRRTDHRPADDHAVLDRQTAPCRCTRYQPSSVFPLNRGRQPSWDAAGRAAASSAAAARTHIVVFFMGTHYRSGATARPTLASVSPRVTGGRRK